MYFIELTVGAQSVTNKNVGQHNIYSILKYRLFLTIHPTPDEYTYRQCPVLCKQDPEIQY